MYRGMECRESLKLTHSKANIKYAERLRGEILNAIELGTFNYAKYFPNSKQLGKFGLALTADRVTVGQLVRDQLDLAKRTLAPSTHVKYTSSYTGYIKKFDDTLLSALTPAELRAWISSLPLKARSIRQLLIPLRSALEQAVNDDLIESNPLDRVKLNKIITKEAKKVEYVVDPFSAAEIQAILDACKGQERNVFLFAFTTGMRPSEYIALRWSSIDWLSGQAFVERSRVMGITRDETKTDSGRRMVDLRHGALEALRAQKIHTAIADDLVFHDPTYNAGWEGTSRLSKRWNLILRQAGVRRRVLYQTRHTFASTLLSTGVNALYVAKQMGHKDTTMVSKTYGKWIEQEDGLLPDIYQKPIRVKLQRTS